MKLRLGLFGLVLLWLLPQVALAQGDQVVYATAQPFENGLMIWRADTAQIWALINDGRAYSFPAASYQNLPDNPIFGTPPSRLRPIFGMGKVWGNYPTIRRALGWPTLDELGFDMPVRTSPSATLLTQFDGSIIQINANHTWQRLDNAAPGILEFRASADPVVAGASVTLYWQVQGTQNALIEVYPAGSSQVPTQVIDHLPAGGSTTVHVPASFTSGVRFVLWAVDPASQPLPVTLWARHASQELVLGVRQSPNPTSTQAAYQPYENGFMLWRSDTGDVLALGGTNSGRVLSFAQSSYANWPVTTDADIPARYVRPVNAFGKVWGNIQQVRDMLGYATGPEQAFEMTIRNFEDGTFSLSLPDGRTFSVSWGFWNF
ncbi:MAG: hypothetical protein CL610_28595 [Anaerolineaceae bacterium]|nr:hypothetical protein [Anaerolineaceae bacterium]